ncbi:MAG: hypothetical protein GWP09_01590 [Nitrospiraceae bacterium]|nr:hypothetical protein [Nitrospiraceae bacterium]
MKENYEDLLLKRYFGKSYDKEKVKDDLEEIVSLLKEQEVSVGGLYIHLLEKGRDYDYYSKFKGVVARLKGVEIKDGINHKYFVLDGYMSVDAKTDVELFNDLVLSMKEYFREQGINDNSSIDDILKIADKFKYDMNGEPINSLIREYAAIKISEKGLNNL